MTIEQTLRSGGQDVGQKVERSLANLEDRISTWDQQVTAYVRQYPGRCLLGALVTGFVVAKIARHL